ncbi:hypothetical protein GCM10027187_40580 [Streptosporangium sandarakinum]|uniref:8-oxo-dGTP pyrophosphatase MutT (NUDIX family) n=1 Tax=Streptosporangium sandarakinum TaxID=1260955 RepID=A0A852V4F9_9ACTN|nr:NUDIX domain-containing protein [Streptosporangium sandarakinum]NYF44612.1 8-oxo-dGTP pyrophosphatase MutT (NUDIX family) [Streptosporangium sandarakinum]
MFDVTADEHIDDPSVIDWPARQAAAAFPYKVVDGRPDNPFPPAPGTTRPTRGKGGLWHWGERQAADTIVTVAAFGRRWLLMVLRDDGNGWAVPGGCLEPGETPVEGAIRECREETGLDLSPAGGVRTNHITPLPVRPVPDPRATNEAWMVTWPVLVGLVGGTESLPKVTGADDAAEADWIIADSYAVLVKHLEYRGGHVFAAHVDMLQEILR